MTLNDLEPSKRGF